MADSKKYVSMLSISYDLKIYGTVGPLLRVLLSQLCAIVNLAVAQRGLSKAVLLVNHEHSEDHATDALSVKDYHIVQENAKGVLDTMKLVYASLEKVCNWN